MKHIILAFIFKGQIISAALWNTQKENPAGKNPQGSFIWRRSRDLNYPEGIFAPVSPRPPPLSPVLL